METDREAFIGNLPRREVWQCTKCGRLYDYEADCHKAQLERIGTAIFYEDSKKQYRLALKSFVNRV
mgnify:FL=1